MTWLLIKMVIRLVVFTGVFAFAAHKHEKIKIQPRYALPLVALVFAALNIALYWLAKPILSLATFGTMWFVMPFVVNGVLLYATDRVLKPLHVEGFRPMLWLAALLTAAHGALYVGLEVLV